MGIKTSAFPSRLSVPFSPLSPLLPDHWSGVHGDTCISAYSEPDGAVGVLRCCCCSAGTRQCSSLTFMAPQGEPNFISALPAGLLPEVPVGWSIRTSSSLVLQGEISRRLRAASPARAPSCSDQTPLLPARLALVPPAQARNS